MVFVQGLQKICYTYSLSLFPLCCDCSDASLMPVSCKQTPPPPTPPPPVTLKRLFLVFGDAARSARIRLHREINGAREAEIEREHTCILATWQGKLVGASDGASEGGPMTVGEEGTVLESETVLASMQPRCSCHFAVCLKQRHDSFERLSGKCVFGASTETNPSSPVGTTALTAAEISGRGFCFEVG